MRLAGKLAVQLTIRRRSRILGCDRSGGSITSHPSPLSAHTGLIPPLFRLEVEFHPQRFLSLFLRSIFFPVFLFFTFCEKSLTEHLDVLMALPLPKPLFILSSLSALLCIVVFIISLSSFGILSVYINGTASILTALYHIFVFTIAWRNRRPAGASEQDHTKTTTWCYSIASVVWAFIVFGIWIVSLGITAEVTVNGPGSLRPSEISAPWNGAIQSASCFFVSVEMLVVGIIAVWCTMMRNKMEKEVAEQDEEKFFYESGSGGLVSAFLSLEQME